MGEGERKEEGRRRWKSCSAGLGLGTGELQVEEVAEEAAGK